MSDTARAALWMTGAIVSFTAMAAAGRAVSLDLDTFEIMLYRSLVGVVIVVTILTITGRLHRVRTRRLGALALRNLAHFTAQNLWFYAIATITFAQVFALEFTAPIWAMLLAVPILGEGLSRRGLIAAAIGLIGVLILARPGAATLSPGLLAAALAAIGFGLTAVLTRRLTRTETLACILFYLTVMQAVFGLICAGYDGDIARPEGAAVAWLVLIGCAGLLAHFCLTNALTLAPASIVMPIDFARLPLIALVGALAYGEALRAHVLVGAALIIAANLVNMGLLRAPRVTGK